MSRIIADTKSEPASQGIEIRTIDHRGIGFILVESVTSAVKNQEFVGQGERQRGGDYERVPRIESGADKLLLNLFLARVGANGSLSPPFAAQVVELVDTQVSEACA